MRSFFPDFTHVSVKFEDDLNQVSLRTEHETTTLIVNAYAKEFVHVFFAVESALMLLLFQC